MYVWFRPSDLAEYIAASASRTSESTRRSVPDPAGDADRDRDRQVRVALDREALALDERAQLLGQDGAFVDVGLGEDQHEFLAAVPADHVGRPQVRAERLGDAAQDHVAGRMAVRVVDGLEVVDVDEGDRQRALVAAGALDLGEERRQERLAVRDARQAVEGGQVVGLGQRDRDAVDRARRGDLPARCPAP